MSPQTQMDIFAERLSEHGDLGRAADETCISRPYGRVLLQRIIKRLGRGQCK